MKKKIKSGLLLLLCMVSFLALGSCDEKDKYPGYFDQGYIEDFFYGHYYDVDKTWRLCSQSWYTSYYDRIGNFYEEIHTFYKHRQGRTEYYVNQRFDGYEYFVWHWDNYGQTRIRIDYAGGDYAFLHDLRVGNYELSYITEDGYEIYYQALR